MGSVVTMAEAGLRTKYRQLLADVRRQLRQMKAAYWDDVARQLEMASKCHDVRLMYTLAKLTDEPKAKGTGAVRGRDGVLLTEPNIIRARWVDHFSGLLNVPSEVDMRVLDHVEQRPVVHAGCIDLYGRGGESMPITEEFQGAGG